MAVTGFHLPGFYAPESSLLGKDEEALFALYLREQSVGMEECPQARAGAVKAAIGRDGIQGAVRARLRRQPGRRPRRMWRLLCTPRPACTRSRRWIYAPNAGWIRGACWSATPTARPGTTPRHEAIAATGAYLEYDTVGRFKYHSDEDEARLIVHMLSRGYGDRRFCRWTPRRSG